MQTAAALRFTMHISFIYTTFFSFRGSICVVLGALVAFAEGAGDLSLCQLHANGCSTPTKWMLYVTINYKGFFVTGGGMIDRKDSLLHEPYGVLVVKCYEREGRERVGGEGQFCVFFLL